MKKFKRNERTGAIMSILTDKPNYIFTYNYFSNILNAAKSTISEDIMIIKDTIEELELGIIETIPGAAGGVRFIPMLSNKETKDFLTSICERLAHGDRIIPGGFLYMSDILYNPSLTSNIGKIFAKQFIDSGVNYVVTVETKGIPLALMTAQVLNVPLIIIRNNSKVTEGSTVSINYVTGSTKKIQTMSLAKRSIKGGAKVLIIDDFMKAGGTAKGMMDMMEEFNAEVIGIGVFVSTEEPGEKLVEKYTSLLKLKSIDTQSKLVNIEINEKIMS